MSDEEDTEKEKKYIPKFMEWGIINKDNFTSIKDVPIKRWDKPEQSMQKNGACKYA